MPTRNVNLTDQLDSFVTSKIESGRYANVSEVIRAGLWALQEDEAEDQAKLESLRIALQAADEGPWLDGPTAIAENRDYIRALAKTREGESAGA